jgi:hypothetical protein
MQKMKVRCIATIFAFVLLAGVVSAQQPAATKPNESPYDPIVDSAPAPTMTRIQQKPILQLLRERELLNAKIEGVVLALYAFFDLSPSEWDLVTEGDGVRFVRRKPATSPATEGDKKQ